MLQFNNVLFTINDFKATIWMKPPYVTSVEPSHSSFINLDSSSKNNNNTSAANSTFRFIQQNHYSNLGRKNMLPLSYIIYHLMLYILNKIIEYANSYGKIILVDIYPTL